MNVLICPKFFFAPPWKKILLTPMHASLWFVRVRYTLCIRWRRVRIVCSTRTSLIFEMKSRDIRMTFIMIESIMFPFKTRYQKFLPNSDKYMLPTPVKNKTGLWCVNFQHFHACF